MKVTTEVYGKKLIIGVHGSIDSTTSLSLRDELDKINVSDYQEVELDFSKVHYISSAGLRELLILQKRFPNGKLNFRNLSDNVLEVFKITGFNNIFNILDKEKEGIDYSVYSFKSFLIEKVKHNPDDIVFDDGIKKWTWKEIDLASNMVAEDLINLGAKKNSHIAICGTNSVNWIYTFFAIQKIGAMAILVNPLLKASEIAFLSHVGDITILCHGIGPWLLNDPVSFLKDLKDPSNSLITALYDISRPVDIVNRTISPFITNFIDSIETRNDDPCVMIFTSGSTGVPKGVLLSSYNILTAANEGAKFLMPEKDDIMCLVLPLFHIFGLVASLMLALIKDLKIILPARIKPDAVIDAIDKNKCSILLSVPTLLMGMASSPLYTKEKLSSLHHIILGGAPVTEAQMLYLQKQFESALFYIVYGLSEMSPVSFTRRGDTLEHITKTVGAPIDLIKVKIQDVETLEECKTYGVGEILIQGEFLMSGYYKTPIEKQDFDKDGWFHTGDLGFLDEDGYIHFAGRKKELIIRGGENIFPGEIADVASKYSGVASVQIIGLPDPYFGEIVGCAIVAKNKEEFSEEEFKNYLKEHLAPHKIPAVIYLYDAFPLLANGKVDVINLKKDMIARGK